MRLDINNLGIIRKAEIDVDGITVIAGSNNTGKSTVGKVIFALFNSLNDMENKVLAQRTSSIRTLCHRAIRNVLVHGTALGELSRPTTSRALSSSRNITELIMENASDKSDISVDFIRDIVDDALVRIKAKFAPDEIDELVNEIYSGVYEVLHLPDKTISQALVSRYFQDVFNDQINTLHKNEPAVVNLNLKKRNIAINFLNHECVSLDSEISILHKALYIANTSPLDQLDEEGYGTNYSVTESPLVRYLSEQYHNDDNQIIESVLASEKMDAIFSMLSSVVKGRILVKDGNYCLKDEDTNQSIFVKNLSTGLKAFVLMKMLFEGGVIGYNDVLILDEPEIHLHPEWQIVYAELIVLLQKHLNLSVVVTTHSPYFLDAIDLFSRKHGIEKTTNYYLSKLVGTQVEFKKVSDCIDAIYKEMASPIDILETLRFELTEE